MSIGDLRKATYDRYARYTDWREVDPSTVRPMELQDVLSLINRERIIARQD